MSASCAIEEIETKQPHQEEEAWALVVDDNPIDRRLAGAIVSRTTGLKVRYAGHGLEALAEMKRSNPSIVLTDMQIPNMDGLELVDQIAVNYPMVPVILMTSKGSDAFKQKAEERRHLTPYRERRLHVHAKLTQEEAYFCIRDEGPGFDPSKLPDPTDPENLLKASGRGILLIRTFMDEAIHSATGNQLTMVKRRK